MVEYKRLTAINVMIFVGGTVVALAQQKNSSPPKEQDRPPIAYEAEDKNPKDKAAEKRRDYAVLEAALNDLASPKNPEHKYRIQNVGPGKEIVFGNTTCRYGMLHEFGTESRNIDNTDVRRVPKEFQDDLERRNKGPFISLSDFKPANPNIVICDLDGLFDKAAMPLDTFFERYPKAWGYVWAYMPAYSKDGNSAMILFEGGPNGIHGLNWVYMLTKKGKRWDVQWRHCCPRE